MQIGRPFTFSNFLLAIALIAVVAGAWRLTQVAAIHFSLWTSAVAAAMIVTALLLGCLFLRFKAKGKVALLAVALAATALVGNYVMAATGHDLRPAAAPSLAGVTQLAAAPAPSNAGSSNARPPVEIVYKSIGTVAAIMPAQNPQPNQGAAFLGVAVAPLHAPATLHIRLTANAYAAQANEVVLAIFRSGQAPALKVAAKPVAANGRVYFDESFDIPDVPANGVSLDVRMGVTKPGPVVINGPSAGAPQADVPFPTLDVTEAGMAQTEPPPAAVATAQAPAAPPASPAPPTPSAASSARASSAQSSNAGSPNAGSSNARPPVEIVYKSIGTVAAIMPAQNPQPNQGAAFLGVAVAPLHAPATLHIRLTANAYAALANEVVLAIFRSGQAPALKVAAKPVAADGRVYFDESFDIPDVSANGVSLDVRMGVTKPGPVVINGPSAGAPHADVPFPTLDVTEAGSP